MERRIADEIMNTIHRLQLPFKLDQLIEGLGYCFPIAIVQQLRRPEVLGQLRSAPKRLAKHKTGHVLLRQSVHQFITKSRSPRVALLRSQYEETDGPANQETWDQYWARMITDKTWVEYWFVQATAWYLQLDLWIVATSSTETNPYIEVSGNLADANIPSGGPIITLGTKSNCHYQSLLPIEIFQLDFQVNHNQQNDIEQGKDSLKEVQRTGNKNENDDIRNNTLECEVERKDQPTIKDQDCDNQELKRTRRKKQELEDKDKIKENREVVLKLAGRGEGRRIVIK